MNKNKIGVQGNLTLYLPVGDRPSPGRACILSCRSLILTARGTLHNDLHLPMTRSWHARACGSLGPHVRVSDGLQIHHVDINRLLEKRYITILIDKDKV
jgi:hypothetical protein